MTATKKYPTPMSDRVEAVIQAFRDANDGRDPKRVVWSPDVKLEVMSETRARLKREDPYEMPLKRVREESERPGIRFVTSNQVPPGTVYGDDLKGDQP